MEDIIKKVAGIATALTKLIVKILEIFNAKPDTGISFGEDEIKDIEGILDEAVAALK